MTREEIQLDSKIISELESYVSNHETADPVLIPITDLNKEDRTKIHAFIRQNYSNLESKTETIDGTKYIKVLHDSKSSKDSRQRSQRRLRWPKDRPSYVHFVLYKENLETVQVVNELARRLACTTKNFTFAGTKDKRAITTQMFSAWKTSPGKIWQAVNEFNRRAKFQIRIHVGHFTYQPEPLKLGDLSGNQFEILLRDVRFTEPGEFTPEELKANVEDAIGTIKDTGFINYFGMQRFGSHRIDSHKLGILILKKNFKQLVNEILVEKPKDLRPYNRGNEISFNEAIQIWRDTGDAALAYRKLSYKYSLEGSLLRALGKVSANDYQGALCKGMLRNSRLLYLHAYQSYLWNRAASFRIQEYGLQVVEGDLVFLGSNLVDTIGEDEEQLGEDLERTGNEEPSDNRIKANIPAEQIILVTVENLDQFSIYDVVLPIVGGLSKLPTNRTLDFIHQILQEDNVSIEDFGSLSKQWCVNGSYRKLLARPSDLTWQWLTYTDDTRPLIGTDLQKIGGNSIDFTNADQASESKLALKICLSLPTSSYATVMLRELTKLSSLTLENKPWQLDTQTG